MEVEEPRSYTVIGESVPRLDALEKVTGRASYMADMKLPDMLYGKALRSPYPHAKILRIDTSKAEKLAGVRAVVTGRDVPFYHGPDWLIDQPLLAIDKVRYVGEAVAAVAATSDEIAEEAAAEALDLIEVEYEELPAVFDPCDSHQDRRQEGWHLGGSGDGADWGHGRLWGFWPLGLPQR